MSTGDGNLTRAILLRRVMYVEATVNFISCSMLNFLGVILLLQGQDAVSIDFWTLALDTCVTCYLTCLLVLLFAPASARRYQRAGLTAGGLRGDHLLQRLPAAPLRLGLLLASMAFLTLTLLFWAAFTLLKITSVTVLAYAAYKGLWGGAWGALTACTAIRRFLLLPAKKSGC